MSESRLEDIISHLEWWENRRTGTKRHLLSLLGKLVFFSRVVRPGRTFLRRLFDLSTKTKFLHHHVRLSIEACLDIKWWLEFARTWNKCSFFLDDVWTPSTFLELYTDASDVGYGALFGSKWFAESFSDADLVRSITYRELYAIVIACATWSADLVSRRLLVHCDNLAVVEIVNTGSCKCREIMCLVCGLFSICVKYNFDIKLQHIPGVNNIAADSLSRLDLGHFFRENPGMYDHQPTKIRRGCDF